MCSGPAISDDRTDEDWVRTKQKKTKLKTERSSFNWKPWIQIASDADAEFASNLILIKKKRGYFLKNRIRAGLIGSDTNVLDWTRMHQIEHECTRSNTDAQDRRRKANKLKNYTDRWPSETNEDGKQTLNLRINNGSRTMDSQKMILKRRNNSKKKKTCSDFAEEWAHWWKLNNRKDVGTEQSHRVPTSEPLTYSWDVIDSGPEHCGIDDKGRCTTDWTLTAKTTKKTSDRVPKRKQSGRCAGQHKKGCDCATGLTEINCMYDLIATDVRRN